MNNSSIERQFYSRIKIGSVTNWNTPNHPIRQFVVYFREICQFDPSANQDPREFLISLEGSIVRLASTFSEEDLEIVTRSKISIDVALNLGDISNYHDFTESLIQKYSKNDAWDTKLAKKLMSRESLEDLMSEMEVLKFTTSSLKFKVIAAYLFPRFNSESDRAQLLKWKREVGELPLRDAYLKLRELPDGSYDKYLKNRLPYR